MSARRIHPQPCMAPVEGSADLWELRARYALAVPGVGVVVIPAGRRWDRASVPRTAAPLVTRDDLGEVAPAVHDECYARAGQLPDRPAGAALTRARSDVVFLALMLLDGVAVVRALLAYAAVRLRGAARWGSDGARAQAALEAPV